MIRYKIFDKWYYCESNRKKPFEKNKGFYYYNSNEIKVITKIEHEMVSEPKAEDIKNNDFYYELCNSYAHNHENRSSFQLLKMTLDFFNLNYEILEKKENGELELKIEGLEFIYDPEYAKLKLKNNHLFLYIKNCNFKFNDRIGFKSLSDYFENAFNFFEKQFGRINKKERFNYYKILKMDTGFSGNPDGLFLSKEQKEELKIKREENKKNKILKELDELKQKEKKIFKQKLEFIKFFKKENIDIEKILRFSIFSKIKDYESFIKKEDILISKIKSEIYELEEKLG